MLFAVASHAVLALVKLNNLWQIERLDVLATGHHYGIALPGSGGGEFITMVRETDAVSIYKNMSPAPSYLYAEANRFVCDGDYGDIHQISHCDGGLYIANTGFNSLDYVSLETPSRQRHFFNGLRQDVNHVNSVYPCGAEQVLSVLNNRGRKLSELAVLRRDSRKGFELIETLPLWDVECHNIFADGDLLVYNASKKGDFVAVGMNTERVIRRIHFPGYTKGLSVTEKHFIVGYSDHAPREERMTSRGHLAVINRRTLDLMTCVNLNHPSHPPGIGNVNEVRCLSETDYGHSRPDPLPVEWERLRLSFGDACPG